MKDLKPIIKSLWYAKTAPLLLILQIAVAFTILVNSVFMLVQKHGEFNDPSGLDEDVLFSFQMSLHGLPEERVASVYRDLDAIRALDSVEEVVTVNSIPLSHRGAGMEVRLKQGSHEYDSKAGLYAGGHQMIETMGLKLIAGEGFTLSDERALKDFGLSQPVGVVITKALAQDLYPNDWRQALGKTLYLNDKEQSVRGIVEQLVGPWSFWGYKNNNFLVPTLFMMTDASFIVRAHKGLLEQSIRDVKDLLLVDSSRNIDNFMKLSETRAWAYQPQVAAYNTLKIVIVGLSIIIMLGVFGQTRYTILKRQKQIGIRRALGASRYEIIRYFMLENLCINVCGILFGLGLTIVANNLLVVHFGLAPVPAQYLLIGVVVVLLAGVLAVLQPVLKTASISPTEATRSA
ncbi:FtsX-like permease family protein [Pseudoalteromonas sp. Of7M-16]|uniref:ABC transporter permease n=1 Tax=Pseudoalteromonas sp. Of7M-16 TaxID=2917756 RepID=UPI001EF6FE0A|nr:FtsX-like permease family protein [Pseudoalteromonas sp. Of7M-16]MCG7548415.1 ABC transporter permease [Pseudoalteromonas sp. Of7M-16]